MDSMTKLKRWRKDKGLTIEQAAWDFENIAGIVASVGNRAAGRAMETCA